MTEMGRGPSYLALWHCYQHPMQTRDRHPETASLSPGPAAPSEQLLGRAGEGGGRGHVLAE